MKAFGKVLGLFFLGLLLLVVALGFALTHLFDPNDYKDEIRQIARDKANLELDLKGDIGWSLFPWLGLELHDTSIASTATPTKPFADLQMLGLSVRVPPLLRKDADERDPRRRPEPGPGPRQAGQGQLGKHRQAGPAPGPSAPSATPPAADGKAPRRRHPSRRRRTTARAPRSSSTSTASTSTTPASPTPTKPAASSTTSRASS